MILAEGRGSWLVLRSAAKQQQTSACSVSDLNEVPRFGAAAQPIVDESTPTPSGQKQNCGARWICGKRDHL
jgi:hypothetical protein